MLKYFTLQTDMPLEFYDYRVWKFVATPTFSPLEPRSCPRQLSIASTGGLDLDCLPCHRL